LRSAAARRAALLLQHHTRDICGCPPGRRGGPLEELTAHELAVRTAREQEEKGQDKWARAVRDRVSATERMQILADVLRNHPTLTREKAIEMLDAFGGW
jgi:hypothetical protein